MKLGILALSLALLAMTPAFAQTSPPPVLDPQPQPSHPSDLDARLHHQPTRGEVNAREKARDGAAAVDERDKQQQKQVDELYQQLMGKPPAGK